MVGRRVGLLPLPQLPRYLPICFGLWQSYARLWTGLATGGRRPFEGSSAFLPTETTVGMVAQSRLRATHLEEIHDEYTT